MNRLFAMIGIALFYGCVGCQSGNGTSGGVNDGTAGSTTTETSTGGSSGSTHSTPNDAGAPPAPDGAAGQSSNGTVTAEGVCCDVSTPSGCSEVRDCVCVDWQQQNCCTEWTTFCQVTAEEKCKAAPGCTGLPTGPSHTTADAGAEKGQCCAAHETPGCADPSIEQCICALLPDCCSVTWDATCVQLVNEKHCEPGVRSCVCDQWQQTTCCDTEWTSFCQTVAEEKCMAQPGCG